MEALLTVGPLSTVQAVWLVIGALQLAALVLWSTPSAARTRTTLPAAALSLVSVLGLCLVSYVEHTRAVRPSSLLNGYLLVTLLFDISHARTLWLRAADHLNQHIIPYICTAAVVVKLIVLVLEALHKRRWLRSEYRAYPPEATSSLYSRSFFWWLNPLFRQGYGRELEVDDLFVLDKHLQASYCYKRFSAAWNSGEDFLLLHPHHLHHLHLLHLYSCLSSSFFILFIILLIFFDFYILFNFFVIFFNLPPLLLFFI
jgi:hypothetical protein